MVGECFMITLSIILIGRNSFILTCLQTDSVYFGTFTHHSNIDPNRKCNHDFTIQVSFVNILYVFSFYFYLQYKH